MHNAVELAILPLSMAGSSSVPSFAISSVLLFPAIPMCPGTHATSICASLFLSRKCVTASTNVCDVRWRLTLVSHLLLQKRRMCYLPIVLFLPAFCSLLALLVGTLLLFPVLSRAPAFQHPRCQDVFPCLMPLTDSSMQFPIRYHPAICARKGWHTEQSPNMDLGHCSR